MYLKKNLLTVTVPWEYLNRIEAERGEVPRSRYIANIIKKHYANADNTKTAITVGAAKL